MVRGGPGQRRPRHRSKPGRIRRRIFRTRSIGRAGTALVRGLERLMLARADLAQIFQGTNARLALLLDSLIPDQAPSQLPLNPPSSTRSNLAPRAATPQQMAALLSELMQAGQWLRSLPSEKDVALERELSQYRKQVERLRAVLPSLQQTLLGERARLERERARVVSAAEWACRSRQTL
jgi:hypothetical protein